jgi:photoactive yellow protein
MYAVSRRYHASADVRSSLPFGPLGQRPVLREGDTMVVSQSLAGVPLGLLELDPQGVVVRYAEAAEEKSNVSGESIIGRDFFTDVIRAGQIEEWRVRFRAFMDGGQSVERFTAKVTEGGQNVKVQVVMAHISERSEEGRRRLALVRIMPDKE